MEGRRACCATTIATGWATVCPAPTGAISFVEREAAAYDEAAVKARTAQEIQVARLSGGCPGSLSRFFASEDPEAKPARPSASAPSPNRFAKKRPPSFRSGRSVKLAPVQAPYFAGAHVLIAADCTAFAYADFHRGFMRGRITLIGCPARRRRLQPARSLFASNDIASVTVAWRCRSLRRGLECGAPLRPGT